MQIQVARISQVDTNPQVAPADVLKSMYEFRGNQRRGRRGPPRGGEFTFRQQPRPRVSDRPLLTGLRGASPDPIFGGNDTFEKFRQVDDLTDSVEEDMDVSGTDNDGEERPSKRLRPGPLWSNPDPYTALPPVTENLAKKHDVVKLIRRSRVTPSEAQPKSTVAANGEDFISFDMHDDALENSPGDRKEAPADAPTGPKNQPSELSPSLGKRKRDPVDDAIKFPPRAGKNSRLHDKGKILREWKASNPESSTPWLLPTALPQFLPGIA